MDITAPVPQTPFITAPILGQLGGRVTGQIVGIEPGQSKFGPSWKVLLNINGVKYGITVKQNSAKHARLFSVSIKLDGAEHYAAFRQPRPG